jgi:hypothetical protein
MDSKTIISALSVPGAVSGAAWTMYRVYIHTFVTSVRWRAEYRSLTKMLGPTKASEIMERRILADKSPLPIEVPDKDDKPEIS